jgi:hypothetical protein
MAKAAHRDECTKLEQIPNIGPAMVGDLHLLGISTPQQLIGREPLQLYRQLCKATEQRHDPCVLDTFMAAVDFMNGAAATPWWHYTAARKARYGQVFD